MKMGNIDSHKLNNPMLHLGREERAAIPTFQVQISITRPFLKHTPTTCSKLGLNRP